MKNCINISLMYFMYKNLVLIRVYSCLARSVPGIDWSHILALLKQDIWHPVQPFSLPKSFDIKCLNLKLILYFTVGLLFCFYCPGAAKLAYTALTLSDTTPYLASCSSFPDHTITIWYELFMHYCYLHTFVYILRHNLI